MPHEAFYATAAGVIPLLLILVVFQTQEYRNRRGLGASRLLAVLGLTGVVVFAGLKTSAARREGP